MVVDVSYISKEHSEDATTASSGVTGILAVQGAFAEHAAMLDRLGAPWKLLRAREDVYKRQAEYSHGSIGRFSCKRVVTRFVPCDTTSTIMLVAK